MAARLKDVAELARVSMKTVSNVVNGYPHVSDELRRRVEEAIRRLDYRPNSAARSLRGGRSGLLALAAFGLEHLWSDELVGDIVHQAAARGFRVVIDPTSPSPGLASSTDRIAGDLHVDAILASGDAANPEFIAAHTARGIPLVMLGEKADPRLDNVTVNAAEAAQHATAYLIRSGRRHVAAIGACLEGTGSQQASATGYRLATYQAGFRLPVEYLRRTSGRDRADGYQAAQELLRHVERPDGIFCYNDRLAVGAIRAITDEGLRVPNDVAVVGIGGSDEGRYTHPSLTTVSTDPAFIAREALRLVAARLAGDSTPPVEIVAPHRLLARESTSPPQN